MCETCCDTGWLNGIENSQTGFIQRLPSNMSPGRIQDEYKYPTWIYFVQPCQCVRDDRANAQISDAMRLIPADVTKHDFNSFKDVPHAANALAFAKIMATGKAMAAGGQTKAGLLFTGGTGTGKSSLAHIIFKHRAHAGVNCMWINFNELIWKIRETYADDYHGQSIQQILKPLCVAQLLVLDDVGSETRNGTMAEDAIEALRVIFEARYNIQLPTIVTTNLDTETQLKEQFGPRVWSRIIGLCHVVEMNGADLRAGGRWVA